MKKKKKKFLGKFEIGSDEQRAACKILIYREIFVFVSCFYFFTFLHNVSQFIQLIFFTDRNFNIHRERKTKTKPDHTIRRRRRSRGKIKKNRLKKKIFPALVFTYFSFLSLHLILTHIVYINTYSRLLSFNNGMFSQRRLVMLEQHPPFMTQISLLYLQIFFFLFWHSIICLLEKRN